MAHCTNWPVVSSMMRRLHPGLTGMLKLVTLNTYNPNAKRGRDEEAIGAVLQRREQVRGVAYEGILSQLLRLRSQHNAPFYTVLKSMVAFRQGLNKDYWRADTSQKLLMSYTWTHDFVLEMTNRPRVSCPSSSLARLPLWCTTTVTTIGRNYSTGPMSNRCNT